ncbi:hypothetical protein HID58_067147 [Brassica napus]|uniref:Uncharacterized protein n=1 Tax=Brassica napus TaxID=3708 RepID=A0ABQ7ZHS3_BRANA|nr:hypothetical protein HID58_067147 [Brassica napus]
MIHLYLQIMSCAKSYVFSTLQYVHIKCVAYGVVGQVLHNFWNSTDATVVLCVLQFWKIAWSGLNHVINIEGFSKILFEPDDVPGSLSFRLRKYNLYYDFYN